jgi:hypothetical protein
MQAAAAGASVGMASRPIPRDASELSEPDTRGAISTRLVPISTNTDPRS